jgi:ABC-type nitrate/sulfonate/bicarbonate transport system permease component
MVRGGFRLPPARRWFYLVSPLLLLVLLIFLWWVATDLILKRPRVYPGPFLVASYIGQVLGGDTGHGPTLPNVYATLFRLTIAWVGSMVIGTLLGIIAGRSRFAFDFMENLVWIFLATPSIVWVFIFVVAIGLSDLVPIFAISALLIPQILIVVAEGAKSMPKPYLELADSYRVSPGQRLRDLYLPYLTPYILASGRNAFALTVKLILVAEVVGLSRGIGYVVKFWRDQTFFAPVIAWGLLLTAFGIAVDFFIFRRVQNRMQGWTSGGRAKTVVAE